MAALAPPLAPAASVRTVFAPTNAPAVLVAIRKTTPLWLQPRFARPALGQLPISNALSNKIKLFAPAIPICATALRQRLLFMPVAQNYGPALPARRLPVAHKLAVPAQLIICQRQQPLAIAAPPFKLIRPVATAPAIVMSR